MLAAQITKLEAQLLQAAKKEIALKARLAEQEELFHKQEKIQKQQNKDLCSIKESVSDAVEVCYVQLLVHNCLLTDA